MSALTTLFSSLANKIRSKTGGSDTYTPPEMVDAIDDVYDAGVASATTPITPSNASPASMTSGTGYKPTANGYAIESYHDETPSANEVHVWSAGNILKINDNTAYIINHFPPDDPTSITPSNSSPASMTSGNIYQPTANGYAIENYYNITPSSTVVQISIGDIIKINDKLGFLVDYLPPTLHDVAPSNSNPPSLYAGADYHPTADGKFVESITSITPLNSAPASLSANSPVIPTSSGYAIASYSSKTPSDTNPPSISSGAIIKASASGYLRQHSDLYGTTLWTNSSPTSSITTTTVNLSQSIANFKYIGVKFKASTSSSATTGESICRTSDLQNSAGASKPKFAIQASNSGSYVFVRTIGYQSDTSLSINSAYRLNNNSTDNTLAIPTSIVGYN